MASEEDEDINAFFPPPELFSEIRRERLERVERRKKLVQVPQQNVSSSASNFSTSAAGDFTPPSSGSGGVVLTNPIEDFEHDTCIDDTFDGSNLLDMNAGANKKTHSVSTNSIHLRNAWLKYSSVIQQIRHTNLLVT